MPNLYLRKETRNGIAGVAYYADPDATEQRAWNPWSDRPTKRNKYVRLNCYRYKVIWL